MSHAFEPSSDSILEGNLHDFVPPQPTAHSSSSPSSAYGGVAPSEHSQPRAGGDTASHSSRTSYATARPTYDHDPYFHAQAHAHATAYDPFREPPRAQHSRPSLPPTAYAPSSPSTFSPRRASLPPSAFPASPPPFPPPHRASLPPPTSYGDPSGGGGGGRGLPEFSRWSPTWISGGYSGDGKGYTTHPPPASTVVGLREGGVRYHDPFLGDGGRSRQDENQYDEESGLGGYTSGGWVPEKGDWEGAGGEYRHGVGFDSHSTKPSASSKKIADRLRRLERQFGGPATATGEGAGGGPPKSVKERIKLAQEQRRKDKAELRERSGVDEKGRLVVLGAKKRAALRWAQGIGAFGVGLASIGTGIFAHPTSPAPPAGQPPLYLLYLVPFLSLGLTLYLFVVRPCSHRPSSAGGTNPHQFVVPLLQGSIAGQAPKRGWFGGGGGGGRAGKASRSGRAQWQQPNAQPAINLVVDASMFPRPATSNEREAKEKRRRRHKRRRQRERERLAADADGNGDEAASLSSLSLSSSSGTETESDAWSDSLDPLRPQRKGILSAVQLEGRWRDARRWVRRVAACDVGAGIVWAAVGIWAVGFGKRCPSGGFAGWCDLYNTAEALAVLNALAFFASFALDCIDLKRTQAPPRLRQQRLAVR